MMNKIIPFFAFFLLSIQVNANPLQFNFLTDKINIKSAPAATEVFNGKFNILQGELLEDLNKDVDIFCDGKKMPYKVTNKMMELYLYASYYSVPRQFSCFVQTPIGIKKNFLQVTVREFPYEEEMLNVDQSRVVLSPENQARADREQAMLNKIYAPRTPHLLFSGTFDYPLNSVRTSIYGNRRVFNKIKKSSHLGNDFRAAIGTPINACNDGKVILVEDLFFSGKTVIIDHGMHFYSMYGHLSSFKVKKDDVVSKGQVIALSGDTGRVSAPHLHWGVKVNGEWIDGTSLIEKPAEKIIQKSANNKK